MSSAARIVALKASILEPPHVLCDESGLCEEVDRQSAGEPSNRCFESGTYGLALIDLSPIEIGHVLIVPRRHVTTSLDLDKPATNEIWERALSVAARLENDRGEPALVLEHGVTRTYEGPACVRHAHVHVCPVSAPSMSVANALNDHLRSHRFFDQFDEAVAHARQFDSHLIGHVSGRWFAGEPQRTIRQVTRRLLASVVESPPVEVDWYFGAGGDRYEQTLRYFAPTPTSEKGSEPTQRSRSLQKREGCG